jgi:hypothetical protein
MLEKTNLGNATLSPADNVPISLKTKFNFDTFCDNRNNSAFHKAKGPNFGVYVVHQKGYVISIERLGLGGSSQSREIQLIKSTTNILYTLWMIY